MLVYRARNYYYKFHEVLDLSISGVNYCIRSKEGIWGGQETFIQQEKEGQVGDGLAFAPIDYLCQASLYLQTENLTKSIQSIYLLQGSLFHFPQSSLWSRKSTSP